MNLSPAVQRHLAKLAEHHGVLTSYRDASGRRRRSSSTALSGVLQALGVPANTPSQIQQSAALAARQHWTTPIEPVQVMWRNQPGTSVDLRLPAAAWRKPVALRLRLESGAVIDWTDRLRNSAISETAKVGRETFQAKRITLPSNLPEGYHDLELEHASGTESAWLIVAPTRAYSPEPPQRQWGLFLPVYALHSRRSWGAGDWGDLERLCNWTGRQGGSVVGTLPMLASFLEADPSPYSPVSRLFWNEFYLDLTRMPEVKACPQARQLLRDRDVLGRVDALRAAPLVDYTEQMRLKRPVIEAAARWFFANGSTARRRAHERYLQHHPSAVAYAQFRATLERRKSPWPQWPGRLRDGNLRPSDYSARTYQYHLYAQWLAHEQLSRVTRRATARGVTLYLDMPLGVRRDGFDCWQRQGLFAMGASGGAPPDPVFTRGQDWGFPPLHPQSLRRQRYGYVLEYLRHHLRCGRMLRLDHAMSLHRLYWVPQGASAANGAYVKYELDEWCAILCLESHRHRATLVGENLGTVPPEVTAAAARHRLRELFVVQYEQQAKPNRALRPVPRLSVASHNTHDMPPFAAQNRGLDIADRAELGLLTPRAAQQEREQRARLQRALTLYLRRRGHLNGQINEANLFKSLLLHLATSDAETMLINMEDLWLETRPQNVPGTFAERVNWRRRARSTLEAIRRSPEIVKLLSRVNRARRKRTVR